MSYANPAPFYTETVTCWVQTGQDGFGGDLWASPVVIKCRWEDAQVEHLSGAYNSPGEEEISNARVYTADPLHIGWYLLRGVSNEANPSRIETIPKAFIIRSTTQIKTVDGDYSQNLALL
jgi:hypothetical protein